MSLGEEEAGTLAEGSVILRNHTVTNETDLSLDLCSDGFS